MKQGLGETPAQAYELRHMLEELTDETVHQAIAKIAETPGAPAHLSSLLASNLEDYEPRGAAIQACDYLHDQASIEASLLDEKLAALRRGEVPSGDFRLPFRCSIHLMTLGAGVVATIGLGGAPVFVAVSIASQVGMGALGWEGLKCPNLLAENHGGAPLT
jgi:hypothetical protein